MRRARRAHGGGRGVAAIAARRAPAHLALATAAAVAMTFGVQGVAAALPAVQEELGLGASELGLFTAIYMLPAVLFALPLGYLADALGRRRMFVAMALLYGVAGGAQAWASSFPVLLALRFVQGLAFGALMPLSVTLIGDAYRGTRQVRAQGLRQVAMAVGELVLPLAGAALATAGPRVALGAQGIVALLAPVGAALLDDRRSARRSGGYARELTEAVRRPGLPAVLTAGFLRFVCKFALIAYLPLMLVGSRGATLGQAALVLGIGSGVAAVVNLLVVRIVHRTAASRLLMGALALVGVSLLAFSAAPTWQVAIGAALVFGLGDGTLMVLQNALVTEAAPESVRGGLVAISGMSRNAGKLVAPLLMGGLILVVSMPASFLVVGLGAIAAVPALRPARRLDGLLRGEAGPAADETVAAVVAADRV